MGSAGGLTQAPRPDWPRRRAVPPLTGSCGAAVPPLTGVAELRFRRSAGRAGLRLLRPPRSVALGWAGATTGPALAARAAPPPAALRRLRAPQPIRAAVRSTSPGPANGDSRLGPAPGGAGRGGAGPARGREVRARVSGGAAGAAGRAVSPSTVW